MKEKLITFLPEVSVHTRVNGKTAFVCTSVFIEDPRSSQRRSLLEHRHVENIHLTCKMTSNCQTSASSANNTNTKQLHLRWNWPSTFTQNFADSTPEKWGNEIAGLSIRFEMITQRLKLIYRPFWNWSVRGLGKNCKGTLKSLDIRRLGPVVWRLLLSANQGLNFNPGLFIPLIISLF